ncbi:hypothetical protein JOM56_000891 [Amanita muscaria]
MYGGVGCVVLDYPIQPFWETLMLPFSEQEIICDSFSTLYNGLAHNDNYIRLFNSAVKFRFSLPFINPARSPANLISIDYSKYVLTSTSNKLLRGNNAVFMMTGHVTECALVNPVPSFEGNSFFGSAPGPLVKRIRLRCIAVEYERLCAYIGSALHFKGNRGFVGPTSAGGIVLATKKLGAAQGATASGPSTPKSRPFLASSPSKSRFGDVNTAKQSGDSFPASLLLEQDVPIYDARGVESFDFSDYNLKHIEDLPHFKEGREDLSPEKYIATVGFAVSVFPYKGKELHYAGLAPVAFYVLFVVVIGKLQFGVTDLDVEDGN